MESFDLLYMKSALKEAQIAFEKGEVPIGALLVKEDQILSLQHNLVESRKDATCHAEILALREGFDKVGDWRLDGTTLYVTVEPCFMCAGAILHARVARIVWGAAQPRHGAFCSLCNVADHYAIHRPLLLGGVMAREAEELMRTFFQGRRADEKRRDPCFTERAH